MIEHLVIDGNDHVKSTVGLFCSVVFFFFANIIPTSEIKIIYYQLIIVANVGQCTCTCRSRQSILSQRCWDRDHPMQKKPLDRAHCH